jgi:hypothetical protein
MLEDTLSMTPRSFPYWFSLALAELPRPFNHVKLKPTQVLAMHERFGS